MLIWLDISGRFALCFVRFISPDVLKQLFSDWEKFFQAMCSNNFSRRSCCLRNYLIYSARNMRTTFASDAIMIGNIAGHL